MNIKGIEYGPNISMKNVKIFSKTCFTTVMWQLSAKWKMSQGVLCIQCGIKGNFWEIKHNMELETWPNLRCQETHLWKVVWAETVGT